MNESPLTLAVRRCNYRLQLLTARLGRTTPRLKRFATPMIIDGHVQYHDCAFQADDPAREADYLIKELDRAHVQLAVLADGCVAAGATAEEANAHVLEAAKAHPGRFIPFAVIRSCDTESTIFDEFARTVGSGNFYGVSVSPALDCVAADSPQMDPVIEAAMRFEVPVWIATGAQPYATPTLVGRLAKRFPRAKIICGHLGGDWFYDAICAGRRCESLYFEISFQGRASFQTAMRELGASRLIYGSGLPSAGATVTKDVVERTRMPAAAKERIFGGNIAALVGEPAIKQVLKHGLD